jgi:hypothetical protein
MPGCRGSISAIGLWRDLQDTVDMVGHNDKLMQHDIRKMHRDLPPTSLRYTTGLIQYHPAVDDLPEQTCFVLAVDRDKIKSTLRIIISLQAGTSPVMLIGVIRHDKSI